MYSENMVVTVKCQGKILREKKGIVYLPFGSEYSILMKNLSTKRALVDVEIDGESVLSSKLIIEANSSIDLERYVKNHNVGNRFKFIEKTDKISEYRGDKVDDGILRVTYQFEKPPVVTVTYDYRYRESCPYDPYPVVTWRDSYTGGGVSNSGVSCNFVNDDNPTIEDNYLHTEGITVPGSASNQKFTVGNIGDLESEVHVITLQLKGGDGDTKVETPITVRTKIACRTCGLTNKSSFHYCVNCGTALNIY